MGSHWSTLRSPRLGAENELKRNKTENVETKSFKSPGEDSGSLTEGGSAGFDQRWADSIFRR